MTKDYLVIHEYTAPYDEATEWKIVVKQHSPEAAVAASGIKPVSVKDSVIKVYELSHNWEGATFVAKEKLPRLEWVKE